MSKWTDSARAFMRQTISGGGERHVPSTSKFVWLAACLQEHGCLELKHYYRDGKRGTAIYTVTDKGRAEFSEA